MDPLISDCELENFCQELHIKNIGPNGLCQASSSSFSTRLLSSFLNHPFIIIFLPHHSSYLSFLPPTHVLFPLASSSGVGPRILEESLRVLNSRISFMRLFLTSSVSSIVICWTDRLMEALSVVVVCWESRSRSREGIRPSFPESGSRTNHLPKFQLSFI